MKRRDFLKLAGSTAAAGFTGIWPELASASKKKAKRRKRHGKRGKARQRGCPEATPDGLRHLLATSSHDRILLKASFAEAPARAPELRVDGRRFRGLPSDSDGHFWAFDAPGLAPGRRHELEIFEEGCPVGEAWQLATLPHPRSRPDHLRLLIYTCAGGHDLHLLYHRTAVRQRLLRRALDFAPDAAVIVGDHVYWDLRSFPSAILQGASQASIDFAGSFDRTAPVLGHANEQVLKNAVDAQIAGLYGTLLRSLPTYFVRDDHDYFEDDRATDSLVTFPAEPFMRDLARSSQWLYYPELLPSRRRSPALPGTGARDRPSGVGEAFGSLRYGRLVEALLYDCKGFLGLGGGSAGLVPARVEAWLRRRMARSRARYVVNVPSNPIGYSAGKFAEWYPDLVVDGKLGTQQPKPGWQAGWLAQHDRLLAAAAARPEVPLFLSGDIHSIAESRILGSGALDLRHNPIVSLVSGSPGTKLGWPSAARGTLAMAPDTIQAESVVPVQEVNGFHLVDFEPDQVSIQHFRWDFRSQSEEEIDSLQPFHLSRYARRRT